MLVIFDQTNTLAALAFCRCFTMFLHIPISPSLVFTLKQGRFTSADFHHWPVLDLNPCSRAAGPSHFSWPNLNGVQNYMSSVQSPCWLMIRNYPTQYIEDYKNPIEDSVYTWQRRENDAQPLDLSISGRATQPDDRHHGKVEESTWRGGIPSGSAINGGRLATKT